MSQLETESQWSSWINSVSTPHHSSYSKFGDWPITIHITIVWLMRVWYRLPKQQFTHFIFDFILIVLSSGRWDDGRKRISASIERNVYVRRRVHCWLDKQNTNCTSLAFFTYYNSTSSACLIDAYRSKQHFNAISSFDKY